MMEMEKKSLFWGHACRASVFCAAIFGILPTAASAAEAVPDWVYEAVGQLDAQGYVDLAGKMPQECSREELSRIVAQGLHEIDRIQQGSLADEYGRITSLAMRDEVHLKLYREQESTALKAYEQADANAKQAEEMLVRQSMRGVNRLEIMRPLQERAASARRELQYTARDYALAQMRRQKAEIAYAKVQEKLGHNKKMLESLERAAKLEPGTQTYQLLAEGYERAGDHKKAKRIRAKMQPQPTSAQSPQHHRAQPEPHQQPQQRIAVPSQQVEQQPSTAYYHPPAALPAPAAPAYTQAPPQSQPNAAYSRQSSTVHPPARAPMPANRIQRSAPRRITM